MPQMLLGTYLFGIYIHKLFIVYQNFNWVFFILFTKSGNSTDNNNNNTC